MLFLHADSLLSPDALPLLERALVDRRIVGGTFMLRFDSHRCLLQLIAFFTRFRFRYFHYGEQGIFVKRSAFEQLGGFREIPLMEDIDFLRRLHRRGQVALIQQPITNLCSPVLRTWYCAAATLRHLPSDSLSYEGEA